MKKIIISFLLIGCFSSLGWSQEKPVQTKTVKPDGTVVINTTTIGKNILGFNDITPVEIYIKGGKVSSIKALPNSESPEYFDLVLSSKLLSKWNGLTPSAAADKKVDAVSGASYSSKAIIGNVKAGLKYAKEHPGSK